jgi:ABC-type multidrug transport system ATPase subunit
MTCAIQAEGLVKRFGKTTVLFLDEPSTSLDPHSRGEVWELIRGLAADGVTVLLTTQYLEEADHLAHDIAVIDRVVAMGTPDELKARATRQPSRPAARPPRRPARQTRQRGCPHDYRRRGRGRAPPEPDASP